MKKVLMLLFVLVVSAACAREPQRVELTASERKDAQTIAENRMQISFRRQEVQTQLQSQLNRLQEEDQKLDIEASKLCFALKKAHHLDAGANYVLDEWKGILVKQGQK